MFKALPLSQTRTWVSPNDPDFGTDAETKWELGALDSRVVSYLRNKSQAVQVTQTAQESDTVVTTNGQVGDADYETAAFGLRGWVNFQDETGDVPFKTTKRNMGGRSYEIVHPDTLGQLPSFLIAQIARELMAAHIVPVAVAKN